MPRSHSWFPSGQAAAVLDLTSVHLRSVWDDPVAYAMDGAACTAAAAVHRRSSLARPYIGYRKHVDPYDVAADLSEGLHSHVAQWHEHRMHRLEADRQVGHLCSSNRFQPNSVHQGLGQRIDEGAVAWECNEGDAVECYRTVVADAAAAGVDETMAADESDEEAAEDAEHDDGVRRLVDSDEVVHAAHGGGEWLEDHHRAEEHQGDMA